MKDIRGVMWHVRADWARADNNSDRAKKRGGSAAPRGRAGEAARTRAPRSRASIAIDTRGGPRRRATRAWASPARARVSPLLLGGAPHLGGNERWLEKKF